MTLNGEMAHILRYQNLRCKFGIKRHPYTKSRIDQIPCVCMFNYSPNALNQFA